MILAAVQSVNASSLQMFGETLFLFFIFLIFHSQALFVPISVTSGGVLLQPTTVLQHISTGCIQQHIYESYFKSRISNDGSSNLALIVTVRVRAAINKKKKWTRAVGGNKE